VERLGCLRDHESAACSLIRMRETARLKLNAKRLVSLFSSRAVILLYHSVAEAEADPWSLSVSPRHFAEQMGVLSRSFRVMPLEMITRSVRAGSLPRRAVAVTFDDGYANNLHNAKPILEQFQIPATVFLTTGYLTDPREFWWDELESILLEPALLPAELTLDVNGSTHSLKLDHAGGRGEDRHSLYQSFYHLLHPMAEDERRRILDQLRAWAGVKQEARLTHRPLTVEETIELADGGLVEIGCHTVTHTPLSSLSPALQQAEIIRSKLFLEESLSLHVNSFAYPYGRKRDYTTETVSIVRQAGFDYACAAYPGAVNRKADIFQLPRMQVADCDGEEFARRLSRWFLS
jgi:peptidoglycan/xylan/chitin deacetylase (PgdA/CDA1 family)